MLLMMKYDDMFCWVEVLTEDVLVAHEHELSRLRNYYEQHKDLLEKVERWKKLWAQFLEYEVCCDSVAL